MSLRVWLPLCDDTNNQGTSNLSTFSYNTLTQQTDGKIGKCYSGRAIYHIENEIIQNSWSLCTWVKASAWSANNDILLCKNTTASDNYQFYFSIINGASLNIGINAGSGSASYSYTFAANTWYHVSATYNGSTYALYINGAQVKTGTITNAQKTGMNNIGINCRSTNAAGTAQTGDSGKKLNDVRIYDHCLSAEEVREIANGLVLHYKLDTQYFKSGTNLVTDVTKGGQTTKLTDGRLGVVTSGTNADTYFTINLSESITNGTTYHFSCDASGISEGQFWNFPLGAQNNTSLPCKIYNGHNEFVFTANDINWGTNRLFMDDLNRTDWEHPATFYNFILTKDATYEVKDESGYHHHGTITGAPTIATSYGRYNTSLVFNGTERISTDSPGADIRTLSCWCKTTKNKSTSQQIVADSFSGMTISFYNGTIIGVFGTTRSTGSKCTLGTSYKENDWNHIVVVKTSDDGMRDIWCNGVKLTPTTNDYWGSATGFFVGARNTSNGNPFYGNISDVRAYCTALPDSEILKLYNSGMIFDKGGNIHTHQFNEYSMTASLEKTAILNGTGFDEITMCQYDSKIYQEPDGSKWIRIFHHNDPTTSGYFTRASDWENGVYKSADAWYDIERVLTYRSSQYYEFMIKQKTTSSATEAKYRWSQIVNPITAVYNDVQPGTVVFNTSTGYTNSTFGGLYKL